MGASCSAGARGDVATLSSQQQHNNNNGRGLLIDSTTSSLAEGREGEEKAKDHASSSLNTKGGAAGAEFNRSPAGRIVSGPKAFTNRGREELEIEEKGGPKGGDTQDNGNNNNGPLTMYNRFLAQIGAGSSSPSSFAEAGSHLFSLASNGQNVRCTVEDYSLIKKLLSARADYHLDSKGSTGGGGGGGGGGAEGRKINININHSNTINNTTSSPSPSPSSKSSSASAREADEHLHRFFDTLVALAASASESSSTSNASATNGKNPRLLLGNTNNNGNASPSELLKYLYSIDDKPSRQQENGSTNISNSSSTSDGGHPSSSLDLTNIEAGLLEYFKKFNTSSSGGGQSDEEDEDEDDSDDTEYIHKRGGVGGDGDEDEDDHDEDDNDDDDNNNKNNNNNNKNRHPKGEERMNINEERGARAVLPCLSVSPLAWLIASDTYPSSPNAALANAKTNTVTQPAVAPIFSSRRCVLLSQALQCLVSFVGSDEMSEILFSAEGAAKPSTRLFSTSSPSLFSTADVELGASKTISGLDVVTSSSLRLTTSAATCTHTSLATTVVPGAPLLLGSKELIAAHVRETINVCKKQNATRKDKEEKRDTTTNSVPNAKALKSVLFPHTCPHASSILPLLRNTTTTVTMADREVIFGGVSFSSKDVTGCGGEEHNVKEGRAPQVQRVQREEEGGGGGGQGKGDTAGGRGVVQHKIEVLGAALSVLLTELTHFMLIYGVLPSMLLGSSAGGGGAGGNKRALSKLKNKMARTLSTLVRHLMPLKGKNNTTGNIKGNSNGNSNSSSGGSNTTTTNSNASLSKKILAANAASACLHELLENPSDSPMEGAARAASVFFSSALFGDFLDCIYEQHDDGGGVERGGGGGNKNSSSPQSQPKGYEFSLSRANSSSFPLKALGKYLPQITSRPLLWCLSSNLRSGCDVDGEKRGDGGGDQKKGISANILSSVVHTHGLFSLLTTTTMKTLYAYSGGLSHIISTTTTASSASYDFNNTAKDYQNIPSENTSSVPDEVALHRALHIPAMEMLWLLPKLTGIDAYAGMQTESKVSSCAAVVGLMAHISGALILPGLPTAGPRGVYRHYLGGFGSGGGEGEGGHQHHQLLLRHHLDYFKNSPATRDGKSKGDTSCISLIDAEGNVNNFRVWARRFVVGGVSSYDDPHVSSACVPLVVANSVFFREGAAFEGFGGGKARRAGPSRSGKEEDDTESPRSSSAFADEKLAAEKYLCYLPEPLFSTTFSVTNIVKLEDKNEQQRAKSTVQRGATSALPALSRWLPLFPLFTLSENGKTTVMFVEGIVRGQSKLSLQPVHRRDVLASVSKLLGAHTKSSSGTSQTRELVNSSKPSTTANKSIASMNLKGSDSNVDLLPKFLQNGMIEINPNGMLEINMKAFARVSELAGSSRMNPYTRELVPPPPLPSLPRLPAEVSPSSVFPLSHFYNNNNNTNTSNEGRDALMVRRAAGRVGAEGEVDGSFVRGNKNSVHTSSLSFSSSATSASHGGGVRESSRAGLIGYHQDQRLFTMQLKQSPSRQTRGPSPQNRHQFQEQLGYAKEAQHQLLSRSEAAIAQSDDEFDGAEERRGRRYGEDSNIDYIAENDDTLRKEREQEAALMIHELGGGGTSEVGGQQQQKSSPSQRFSMANASTNTTINNNNNNSTNNYSSNGERRITTGRTSFGVTAGPAGGGSRFSAQASASIVSASSASAAAAYTNIYNNSYPSYSASSPPSTSESGLTGVGGQRGGRHYRESDAPSPAMHLQMGGGGGAAAAAGFIQQKGIDSLPPSSRGIGQQQQRCYPQQEGRAGRGEHELAIAASIASTENYDNNTQDIGAGPSLTIFEEAVVAAAAASVPQQAQGHELNAMVEKQQNQLLKLTQSSSPSTNKVFALFTNDGSGIERGEGHGPRKEFFDGIATMTTSKFQSPLDLSPFMSVFGGRAFVLAQNTAAFSEEAKEFTRYLLYNFVAPALVLKDTMMELERKGAERAEKKNQKSDQNNTAVTISSIEQFLDAVAEKVKRLMHPINNNAASTSGGGGGGGSLVCVFWNSVGQRVPHQIRNDDRQLQRNSRSSRSRSEGADDTVGLREQRTPQGAAPASQTGQQGFHFTKDSSICFERGDTLTYSYEEEQEDDATASVGKKRDEASKNNTLTAASAKRDKNTVSIAQTLFYSPELTVVQLSTRVPKAHQSPANRYHSHIHAEFAASLVAPAPARSSPTYSSFPSVYKHRNSAYERYHASVLADALLTSISDCSLELVASPPFAHDTGAQFAWLQPTRCLEHADQKLIARSLVRAATQSTISSTSDSEKLFMQTSAILNNGMVISKEKNKEEEWVSTEELQVAQAKVQNALRDFLHYQTNTANSVREDEAHFNNGFPFTLDRNVSQHTTAPAPPPCADGRSAYWTLGWALGNAIANGCFVSVAFPPFLFEMLLPRPKSALLLSAGSAGSGLNSSATNAYARVENRKKRLLLSDNKKTTKSFSSPSVTSSSGSRSFVTLSTLSSTLDPNLDELVEEACGWSPSHLKMVMESQGLLPPLSTHTDDDNDEDYNAYTQQQDIAPLSYCGFYYDDRDGTSSGKKGNKQKEGKEEVAAVREDENGTVMKAAIVKHLLNLQRYIASHVIGDQLWGPAAIVDIKLRSTEPSEKRHTNAQREDRREEDENGNEEDFVHDRDRLLLGGRESLPPLANHVYHMSPKKKAIRNPQETSHQQSPLQSEKREQKDSRKGGSNVAGKKEEDEENGITDFYFFGEENRAEGEEEEFSSLLIDNTIENTRSRRQNEINVGRSRRRRCGIDLLNALREGFFSSTIATSPVLAQCPARIAQSLFCGSSNGGDDGKSDTFRFDEQFNMIADRELRALGVGRAFYEILLDVLNEAFIGSEKRELLRFITGRTLLPPRPKAEHIKIEMPLAAMNAKEFDRSMQRLPSSHSCGNVIEVPNYLEAMLMGSRSPYYTFFGRKVGSLVMDSHKEEAWKALTIGTTTTTTESRNREKENNTNKEDTKVCGGGGEDMFAKQIIAFIEKERRRRRASLLAVAEEPNAQQSNSSGGSGNVNNMRQKEKALALLIDEVRQHTVSKLKTAVLLSNSYELDDAAVPGELLEDYVGVGATSVGGRLDAYDDDDDDDDQPAEDDDRSEDGHLRGEEEGGEIADAGAVASLGDNKAFSTEEIPTREGSPSLINENNTINNSMSMSNNKHKNNTAPTSGPIAGHSSTPPLSPYRPKMDPSRAREMAMNVSPRNSKSIRGGGGGGGGGGGSHGEGLPPSPPRSLSRSKEQEDSRNRRREFDDGNYMYDDNDKSSIYNEEEEEGASLTSHQEENLTFLPSSILLSQVGYPYGNGVRQQNEVATMSNLGRRNSVAKFPCPIFAPRSILKAILKREKEPKKRRQAKKREGLEGVGAAAESSRYYSSSKGHPSLEHQQQQLSNRFYPSPSSPMSPFAPPSPASPQGHPHPHHHLNNSVQTPNTNLDHSSPISPAPAIRAAELRFSPSSLTPTPSPGAGVGGGAPLRSSSIAAESVSNMSTSSIPKQKLHQLQSSSFSPLSSSLPAALHQESLSPAQAAAAVEATGAASPRPRQHGTQSVQNTCNGGGAIIRGTRRGDDLDDLEAELFGKM